MKLYYQKNKIDPPINGRRFAIGDIHGCYKTFRYIVRHKLELQKSDHLYLLGDYINKGPESKRTLNYIISLIEEGYKVFPLRGNHEEELIDAVRNEPRIIKWLLRRSPDLLKDGKVRQKHIEFIDSLPYYYKLPDFLLVHAGFNFDALKPLKDKSSMLWRRMPEKTTTFGGDRRIIHAHQPQALEIILSRVFNRAKIIGLDNGVNYIKKHKYYEYSKMGHLCALNLDTFDLIVQRNIENTAEQNSKKKKQIA